MRLKSFTLETDDIRLTQELTTGSGSVGDRSGLVLALRSADGPVGRGATAPLPGAAQRLDDLAAEIERWASAHVNHDIDEAVTTMPTDLTPAARFAIHTALIDLQAQAAEAPLAQFLRVGSGMAVATNALVSSESAAEVYERCRSAVDDGFSAVKLKVGFVEPGADATRIIAASEACGSGTHLRLDANCSWALDDAVHVIGRVGRHRVQYVEDPVADVGEYASFTAETGVEAAVDVPPEWANDLAARIESSSCRYVVMKPAAVGGVDRILGSAVALGDDVTTIVSSSIDGPIALAAAAHVAAAVPVPAAHGLATGPLVEGVPPELFPVHGSINLPTTSGVGDF